MPEIIIPNEETSQYTRPSRGEIFGSLWKTQNIDLVANAGKIRLPRRTYRVFDSGDESTFEVPVAFVRTDADNTDKWWGLVQAATTSTVDGLMFRSTNTDPTGTWVKDDISGSPTDCVDNAIIFGKNVTDQLYVARDTDIAELNQGSWVADWWTNASHLNQSALTATNPHYIYNFGGQNIILIPDGRDLHTVQDTKPEVVTKQRIQLPNEYQFIWMADDGLRVYIGARHIRGGRGLVFPWDGTSDSYDEPLDIFSESSFCGKALNGVMHVVNKAGQLLQFNGSGFDEIAHFPVYDSVFKWGNNIAEPERMVNPNGIDVIDGRINILIANGLGDENRDSLENMPAGIWEYDPKIGLYNKYTLGGFDGVTNDNWGDPVLEYTGALKETNKAQGKFLAGASFYTANSTSTKALYATQSTTTTRGFYITSELSSKSAIQLWKRLKLIFKRLENSTDRIIIKFRTQRDEALDSVPASQRIVITWQDGDTFRSIDNDVTNGAIGDEIEILRGKGAGTTVHLTTAGAVGGNDINIDETVPNASLNDFAEIRIQNWTKLGSISDQGIQKQIYTIVKKSTWIQFKIELRGDEYSPEIAKLLAKYSPKKT